MATLKGARKTVDGLAFFRSFSLWQPQLLPSDSQSGVHHCPLVINYRFTMMCCHAQTFAFEGCLSRKACCLTVVWGWGRQPSLAPYSFVLHLDSILALPPTSTTHHVYLVSSGSVRMLSGAGGWTSKCPRPPPPLPG